MRQTLPCFFALCLVLCGSNSFAQLKLVKCNFYYDSGKKLPDPAGLKRLDSIVTLLQDYDVIKLSLSGYADSIGDSSTNFLLSKMRTDSVYHLLLKNGVNPKIIKLEYHGESQPFSDNGNEQGRRQNRRVALAAVYQTNLSNTTTETDTFKIGRKNSKWKMPTRRVPNFAYLLSDWLLPPDSIKDCKRIEFKLPRGTIIRICETDYYRFKDCMKWTENYPDISATKTKRATSEAYLELDLAQCDTVCTGQDIEVWIPPIIKGGSLYMMGDKGWKKIRSKKMKRGDTTYMGAIARCNFTISCMEMRSHYPIKFRNRSGKKIVQLQFQGGAAWHIDFEKKGLRTFKGKVPDLASGPDVFLVYKEDTVQRSVTIHLSQLKGRGKFKGMCDDKNDPSPEFCYKKKYFIRRRDLH